MYHHRYPKMLAVIAILLLSHSGLNSLTAQDEIPETPAGNSLSQFLHAVNEADDADRLAFLKDGFEKNDEATVEERSSKTDRLRSQLGHLELKKILKSTERKISASCDAANGPSVNLTITVTEETGKIGRIELELGNEDGSDEMADAGPLDAKTKQDVIERLATELRTKYVFPDVGEEMATAVEKSIADGEFDELDDANEFAKRLTDQLRDICHDKHLRIRAGSSQRPGKKPGRRQVDNHGFAKLEMLPGGVGYLKFNYFSGDQAAEKTAAAAMNFLGNSNAVIFDLRDNGGGSPEMIAFLSSYLFDEPVHLNSFYNRPTDTTTETWTRKEVPGDKLSPQTPVFVLTSNYTFSGAEEFTYNLKNLKRGTIVGETTGGGAHPVMPVSLGKRMHITMPFARAINPITETNWEGVGVEPDVKVASDQALKKALELAKESAVTVASRDAAKLEKTETANVELDELMQNSADLMESGAFDEAVDVLAKLTELDPKNGAGWFRYAYCLHMNGDLDQAIVAHQKAAEFDQFAGISTYNLACAYSLKNQADDAFGALEKAFELGFNDVQQLQGDSDFDNVRKDKRFAKLLKKMQGGD